jgi:hypothetical protein
MNLPIRTKVDDVYPLPIISTLKTALGDMRDFIAQMLGTDSTSAAARNDFRLTLTTAVPVTTADVVGATSIYCSPYKGKKIGLYDGTNWNLRSSAEFSLALGSLTSGLPYAVYCYDNAGVPALEFQAWTNGTTRATALALQDGVLVKSGTPTRRFLGDFYTTATTTTEDSKTKRYLWNYYHRTQRNCLNTFTADRTTASTTYVELNTEIRCNFLIGVAEDAVFASADGTADISLGWAIMSAIAFDSTTVAQAGFETGDYPWATAQPCSIAMSGTIIGLAAGIHYMTLLGKVQGTTGNWHSSSGISPHKAKVYLHAGIQG